MQPRCHWEKARGTRKENIKYCRKDGCFLTTFPPGKWERAAKEFENYVWRPWQQRVIDFCKKPAEKRTIHWYWDKEGSSGKTSLTRFLILQHRTVLGGGKASDVYHQCAKKQDEDENWEPEVIIYDVPRRSLKYVSYQALEKLKDRTAFSGKYEGSLIYFVEEVNVIVFANEAPDLDAMSSDRWHVVNLDDWEYAQ